MSVPDPIVRKHAVRRGEDTRPRTGTPDGANAGVGGRPGRRPQGAAPGRLPRLFRSMVFDVLRGMPRGSLRLVLPEGVTEQFGGDDPAAPVTINVLNDGFFRKCVLHGDIGFGESYVAGDWDTDDLPGVISWFLLNISHAPEISGGGAKARGVNLLQRINRLQHLLRDNTPRGSRKNIGEHYDLSNDFFSTFLDPTMTYSSAIFTGGDEDLERAQVAKYDRLCRELRISSLDHVLEIGTGWGGFAIHAASHYGCRVTTITVSEQQLAMARRRIAALGLDRLVESRLCDYRHVTGAFDKIVSIEMLEAVGHRHMETFFRACHRLLKPFGALGLQVIVSPDSRYDNMRRGVDWIQKHIFPGSLLPSVKRINGAINATGDLSLRDLKDFGLDYARTLRMWRTAFNAGLGRVRDLGFGGEFIRKWNYYLAYCEAAFRMRNISVQQMVYTRPNNIYV